MISTKIKYFESASYAKGFYVPSHNDILVIKERLNLPPVTVYVGNYKGSKFKVVGYKGDNLILFSIIELYETQVEYIAKRIPLIALK